MAGVVAAIAAARNGASTLLVDHAQFLGGNATGGLLGNFLTFHNMKGEQICKGISQEIVDACIELGGAFPEYRGHLRNAYGNVYSCTPIDPEVLKLVTQKLCVEAGVRLMLGAFIVGPIAEGDTIRGIRVVSKSGEQQLLAKVVIDATGDADIVAKAGGAFHMGDDAGKTMSISLLARLGNVDLARHLQYVKERPDQFMLGEDPYIGKTRQEVASELRHWKEFPMITGYYEAVKEAQAKGEFHRNRERVLFSVMPTPGVVVINSTSMLGYNPVDAVSMTRAALEAREQTFAVVKFFRKYVPGFEESVLLDSASALGIRESRRIVGVDTLRTDDCLAGKKSHQDIGRGAHCLDVHEPSGKITHKHIRDGESYGIPYWTLVPEKLNHILVAGRCLSSERYANGSARMQAHIQAMGQAAGTAAAMCVKQSIALREVDVATLRARLQEQGAVV
jgi:hypothetical protein